MVNISEEWKREIGYTIRDVDTSSDGEYIIVGSFDYHVYLYDKKGTLLWSYRTGDTVRDVAISFDGRYMAAGSYDEHVYFFNTNGDLLWKRKMKAPVRDISISAGGEYLVVGSNDKQVYFFDWKGQLLWEYPTAGSVFTVALSMRGEYVSVGSNDRKVYFFNRLGDLLWMYETGSAVRDVEMTSRGKYIAAGSYDHYLYFFDRSGRLIWKRKRETPIGKVAISPSGEEIATGGEGDVALFDRNGNLLWSHSTGQHELRGLEISTKGGSVICGTRDNELLYFDKIGRLLWRYRTPQWVETVAVGSRGRFITAGLRNGVLYLFDSLDFFRMYIEDARKAIVKLENLGSEAGKARNLYESAILELETENYMEALALAIRAKSLADRSLEKNRPQLSYIVETEKPIKSNTWKPIYFKIKNNGRADAQDILIRFHGPIRCRGEKRIDVLRADSGKILKMDMRPMHSGNQKIEMSIVYFDFGGREYSIADSGRIKVQDWMEPMAESTDRALKQTVIIFKKSGDRGEEGSPLLRTEPKCPNCNKDVQTKWIACPYCATQLR